MADSFSKKEGNKKKAKKKQDKALRREDRKVNNNKGKSLEDMLIYVDKNGNFTSIPPHLQSEDDLNERNITSNETSEIHDGMINFLHEKGYGFITEDKTRDSLFFNYDVTTFPFKKNDKVTFKKEVSLKGFKATHITKK